jgi:hypothetical protein
MFDVSTFPSTVRLECLELTEGVVSDDLHVRYNFRKRRGGGPRS